MDLGAIVNAARRAPGNADPRAGTERLALSLRVLLPIVESVGATPELARELRARPASDAVNVVLPTGSGQARVDLGPRQVVIPAALRDAILVALEQSMAQAKATQPPGTTSVPTSPAPASIDPAATARLIDASANTAQLVARSGELARTVTREPVRSSRDLSKQAHATFSAPLLDAQSDVPATALRLRAAVERSGLFFESHLAEWARGDPAQRGLSPVPDELHNQAAVPVATRTAAQLDVLARDTVQLQGPAWAGQVAAIELRREGSVDPDARGDMVGEPGANAFSACIRFDLPQIGALDVELRLVGMMVAVTIKTQGCAIIERELPRLASQLELRGLLPVALRVTALP
jgi:hypothetical protein